MEQSRPPFSWPLAVSISLHVILISFFFIHFTVPNYRLPGPVMATKIVQAVALDQNQVTERVQQLQQQEQQKKAAELQQLQKLQAQAQAANQQREQAQQQVKALQLKQQQVQQQIIQQKALAQKQLQQQLAQQKAAALKKQQADLAKAKKLAQQKKLQKQQKLAAQKNNLQQSLMQQQIAQEQKELTQQAQTAQNQGVIDEFRARIQQAIEQNWIVPDGVDRNLKSLFMIQLGPGGVVLSVRLLQSSGNDALDHSAQVAIYKASPLPVPKDPSIFDNFRELRLTVTPKEIVNG